MSQSEMQVTRATRKRKKIRIGIVGPSGSGKTFTALRVARGLVGETGKVLVIDTERGSASMYADMATVAGEFDSLELQTFSPQTYIEALNVAAREGYDVVIVDSLSHAWSGKDGALEQVDKAAARNRGNSFAGWRDVTPLHNQMVDAILTAPFHVIATMRSKSEWVIEEDPNTHKKVPRKIGMQPIQRDGLEYEFDIVGDMDMDHRFIVSKTRIGSLTDKVITKPNGEISAAVNEWLSGAVGAETQQPRSEPQPPAEGAQADLPQEPPPAKDAVIAQLRVKLSGLAKEMGYAASEISDALRSIHKMSKLDSLSIERATEFVSDIEKKKNMWNEMVNLSRKVAIQTASDATEADVIDRVTDWLAEASRELCDGHPLRATFEQWHEWLRAFEADALEVVA